MDNFDIGGNFMFCVIFISDGNRVSFPSQFLSLGTFYHLLAFIGFCVCYFGELGKFREILIWPRWVENIF